MKVTKSTQRPAIWALLVGSAVCAVLPLSNAQKPVEIPSTCQSKIDDFEIASGRLVVHPPAHPLRLGVKNPIEITLTGPKVLCLGYGEDFPFGDSDDNNQGCSPVHHRLDGKTYIDVVPSKLGEMDLDIVAVFADCALEKEPLQFTVSPPHPPQRLDVGEMMPSGKSMEYLTVGEHAKIGARAEFAGLLNPLPISEKGANFRLIRQTKGDPAIRFDPSTGTIDAERLGDALIESSFAGMQQTTCVMVREHWGYSPGNCEELREGGNGILPTAQGADAPGADDNSALPYSGCHPFGICDVHVGWVNCDSAQRLVCDYRLGRFVAEERLVIVPPTHPFNIAELNAVTLKTHGSKVARVECGSHCIPVSSPYGSIDPPLAFQEQPDGSVTVQIFPSQIGSIDYDLSVYFADGGVAHKAFNTEVGFGSKQPRGIDSSCGTQGGYPNAKFPILLRLPEPGLPTFGTDFPPTYICYEGVLAIQLPRNLVTYRILGDTETPIFTVNPATGALSGLRAGESLLEREFRGLKSQNCVVVRSDSDQHFDNSRTHCDALRARYEVPPKMPQMTNPHD